VKPDRIYHLVPQSELRAAVLGQSYRPASLVTEGFIHCTGERQLVLVVANTFFAELDEPLLLLDIEVPQLRAELRWEAPVPPAGAFDPGIGVGRLFPHLYGALNLDAVAGFGRLAREGGRYQWPRRMMPLVTWPR